MRIELIAFVAGAALACVIAPSVAQNTAIPVTIDNFVFEPERLTVRAGTTVTWINRDDIPHTVVATDGSFKSPVLDTDERFTRQFGAPGAYPYYCSVHPRMTGKILVRAG